MSLALQCLLRALRNGNMNSCLGIAGLIGAAAPGTRGIIFDPVLPVYLLVLAAAAFIGLTLFSYWKINDAVSRRRSTVLAGFRLCGIALLFVLLLQPSRQIQLPPPKINKVTLVAVDSSRSMNQNDVEKTSRLEAAKNALYDTDFYQRASVGRDSLGVRLFEFSTDAAPLNVPLEDLKADGTSTRMNHSIISMLNSLGRNEEARALVIVTDGHDFELVNPTQTGVFARTRHVPIYAVPVGKQGNVRDVSVRIGTYSPYTYVKQKTRISGVLRLVGCEYEDLTVQLLRNDKIVQTKHVSAGESRELTVDFEVTEPEVGQYEYEVKVLPLENELDVKNNSALTYLNVVDQQIQVLLLEGSPYWDTTFLQRSLLRNDKINLDSILQYSTNRARVFRKKGGDLKVPVTPDEFNQYDVIIVGRSVDRMFDSEGLENLKNYVREHGGTLIFSRGRAFGGQTNELEPVLWDDTPQERVRLQVSREGMAASPFKMLSQAGSGAENAPDLLAGRKVIDRKPLSAILAQAQGLESGDVMPGFVQRRFGQGQVLSVGVEGLWKWAFNAKAEEVNTLFDRFWDQTILWMMAGRDVLPNRQYSFRCGSANILVGEKVYFKLVSRTADPNLKSVPVTIYQDEREIGRTALVPDESQTGYRLTADFLPEKTGKYRAVATMPDGTKEESRFIVFDDNLEETEVATDTAYLKRLCESSGGRLLAPGELKKLAAELESQRFDATPKKKIISIWDRPWVYYTIGLLFGCDWYLRRRWGLS